MPIFVACPSCGSKLRVADALVGQMARCPACHNTFDTSRANEPPPAPEPRSAPENLPLQLSVDDPTDKPRPAPPPPLSPPNMGGDKGGGLVGAVELKLSLDEEPAAPPRTPSPPQPPSEPSEPPKRPPRLSDTDDDLQTCPVCGKHVHRDSTRCYNCGEWLDGGRDSDDRRDAGPTEERRRRPSILREPPRRDREPDRGGMILTFGVLSLVMLMFCPPIGLILGLLAWVMGQGDLRKIKAGHMDPEGQGMTYAGWLCGIIGVAGNLLTTLACAGFFGLAMYGANQPARPIRPMTRPAPPVQKWPNNNPVWKDAPPKDRR